jgi:hypothetical protein
LQIRRNEGFAWLHFLAMRLWRRVGRWGLIGKGALNDLSSSTQIIFPFENSFRFGVVPCE